MLDNSPAIDRLGVPAYHWWNECLHGVGRAGLATVFPQAIGMAAMWDKDEMYRIADIISDEARAKHHDFVSQGKRNMYQGLTFWSPNINIFRDPRWGRGMETYGEDPFLAGELAVQFIRGLQGDDPKYLKTVATAKHFAVHSGPEPDRHRFNAVPSDRDLVETYLPHFRKTIQEANVYSVMCAYNRLFDVPCCASKFLESMLRVDWGFEGYIVSDCYAIRDFYREGGHGVAETVEEASALAVKAGTDLNCGNSYHSLVKAVELGLVSEREINVSVTRLMLARMKLGMFDPENDVPYSKIPISLVDSEKHQLAALDAARKSLVLLKNDNNILPLSKNIKNVAVIGPNADNTDVLLGNYNGYPSRPVTPYKGIVEKLPGAKVTYSQGSVLAEGFPQLKPVPGSVLFTDQSLTQPGLTAMYYNNSNLEGDPFYTGVDRNVDFAWWTNEPKPGIGNDHFSVRWTGYLVPEISGDYFLGGAGFSGLTLFVNDSLFIQRYATHHPRKEYRKIFLEEGKPYRITLEYKQLNSTYPMVRLLWDIPGQQLIEEAVDIANDADVVILCLGLSPHLEGEEMKVDAPGFKGGDRLDIALPDVQTNLVKAIMKLKKPTVLVLLNGSALAINWEAGNVPAILEAWYPGQAGGTAIADVLFGDYNPAGRLPVTFYSSVHQLPPFDDYSMAGRTYKYVKEQPLYEFGYGLSYTTFQYANVKIPESVHAGQDVTVKVDVTNTGDFDGDEVVQLYVSHNGKELEPIRSLQGFRRIHVKAGETQHVSFLLSANQLSVYDAEHGRVISPGFVDISVGGKQPDSLSLSRSTVIKKRLEIIDESVPDERWRYSNYFMSQ